MGDEFEGNADVADMAKDKGGAASDDDIEDEMDIGGGHLMGKDPEELLQQQII